MPEISRIYKNSADETIRVDSIIMIPTQSVNTSGSTRRTFARQLSTQLVLEGTGDRQISVISLITDADDYDPPGSGPANYEWASWESHGGIRCNMTDLPKVGESV